jgi:hypothetical protein
MVSQKEERSAIVVSGYYLEKESVLEIAWSSKILVIVPRDALIVGD